SRRERPRCAWCPSRRPCRARGGDGGERVGRTLPWLYSAGLHAILIVLLSLSFRLHTRPASVPPSTAVAMQATVVDEARIQKEIGSLEATDRRRAQEQQRQADRAEAARQAREKEEQ